MNRVLGKVALVTGAAQGIGKEIASLLRTEGAHVILTDIHETPPPSLANLLNEQSSYHCLDVSSELHWKNLSSHIIKTYGHLDILINNAGITGLGHGPQDPEHASLESWHTIHRINLDGVFLGCKYGIALMKQRGGSIVNMSSRSGLVGVPAAAAYASSKAAIRNHTKSVALYCAQKKYGIRCNSIHPGAILTPLWDDMLGTDANLEKKEILDHIEADIPLGHMGTSEDVAYGALYFASDESKYVTGSELVIDGGITCGSTASLKSTK